MQKKRMQQEMAMEVKSSYGPCPHCPSGQLEYDECINPRCRLARRICSCCKHYFSPQGVRPLSYCFGCNFSLPPTQKQFQWVSAIQAEVDKYTIAVQNGHRYLDRSIPSHYRGL